MESGRVAVKKGRANSFLILKKVFRKDDSRNTSIAINSSVGHKAALVHKVEILIE